MATHTPEAPLQQSNVLPEYQQFLDPDRAAKFHVRSSRGFSIVARSEEDQVGIRS